jgi:phage-related minor tail protein
MIETSHGALPVGGEQVQQLAQMTALMAQLRENTDGVGRALSTAFARGVVQGKRFEDVLRGVGLRLSETLLRAAFRPLEAGLSGLVQQGLSGLASGFAAGAVQPFADGGVIAAPAYFPMGRQIGLMGERGPEAILPLARGPDGRLGVRAGAGGASPVVNVRISTPDADSFRRSEAQVSAAIARAVARGRRAT